MVLWENWVIRLEVGYATLGSIMFNAEAYLQWLPFAFV